MTPKVGTPRYAGASEVGRVRDDNEDSLLIAPPLFAVADGLGGHLAGEVASRIAVDTLLAHAPRRADAKALGRAVRAANRAVMDAAAEGRGRAGMGTTLTAAMVEGHKVYVAHVGDSRAYLLRRDGTLTRVTQDHSMVADLVRQGSLTEEESRVHPNRSVITRALGSDPGMAVDTLELAAEAGDRLMLCTDGLSSLVPDEEIAEILSRRQPPDEAVKSLVAAAQLAGGYDNITAVVVDLGGEWSAEEAGHPGHRPSPLLWTLTVLALTALIAFGVYRYAASRAYLIAEDGVVVVYSGVPGSLGPLTLHWRDTASDVRVEDLPVADRAQLRQGVTADSLAQAEAMLAAYRVAASRNTSPSSAPGTFLPAPDTTGAPAPSVTPTAPDGTGPTPGIP